jgi:hypothetical protein
MELSGSYPNISRYVSVKEVNYTTPNFLDSTGNVAIPSIHRFITCKGSGSLGGAFAGGNRITIFC